VYRRACELDAFDLVIVDEAHLITTEGDGMYRQFLSDALVINPHLRVIGMTATPFRLKSGLICSPDHFLNHVCYEIGIRELIRDGYLCPLVSKAGKSKAHTENVSVRGGEFVAGELESLMNRDSLVEAACREIVERTADRQSCLIFASGVEHGKHIARILREKHNAECGFVCGETPASEREELLARFRGDSSGTLFGREPLKYLCNVNVLTTGFDAPNIDCIALLRPTMSPGLLVQMVGRGLRQHPDKQDCQILDFGGNIERHGPIDQIKVKEKPGEGGPAPAKECPECNSVIAAGYAVCPDCGYEFPPPDRNPHESEASSASVLSGEITNTVYEVQDVTYYVHTKRGADEDAPKTMRVEYQVGFNEFVSEWVCFEHTGFARRKAEAWWRKRSPDPVPPTAERAVELAEAGALADTHSITVRSVAGEPYDRVVDYELGELPEPVGVDNYDSFGGVDDIPF
jgi:DNA repair protein RadD